MKRYLEMICKAIHDYEMDNACEWAEWDETLTEKERESINKAANKKYWELMN